MAIKFGWNSKSKAGEASASTVKKADQTNAGIKKAPKVRGPRGGATGMGRAKKATTPVDEDFGRDPASVVKGEEGDEQDGDDEAGMA